MEFVIPGLILMALIAFFLRATRSKAEFIIDLEDDRLSVRQGKVPRAFLREGRALLSDVPCEKGTVTGVKRGERIALEFSDEVPRVLHQRFRNIWILSGDP